MDTLMNINIIQIHLGWIALLKLKLNSKTSSIKNGYKDNDLYKLQKTITKVSQVIKGGRFSLPPSLKIKQS